MSVQLLHSGQLSQRQIGLALGISKSTVSEIASDTRAAGLDGAQAQQLSEIRAHKKASAKLASR